MSTTWRSSSDGSSSGGPGIAPAKADSVPTGATTFAPTRTEAPGPPLHAALDYCARRLLATLEANGNGRVQAGAALATRLTPASDSLLRWWFSTDACKARIDNFHFAQREAILHTVLAYESLRSDDPAQLYRRACEPQASAVMPGADDLDAPCDTHYRLRLAPGGGGRWIVQALLVWWWANAIARVDDGPALNAALRLIAATPGIRHAMQCGLFGHGDRDAEPDVDRSSLVRHTRLFLPPALRAPFREWLTLQSRPDAALRVVEADDKRVDGPALSLMIASGVEAGANASSRSGTRLRIDVMLGGDAADAIVDAPLERMIRRGAAKLPMLESVTARRLPILRETPPQRRELRPRLSRGHPHLLRAGIAALIRREAGFATLDPARRPRMLVLCDASSSLRAARRFLIDSGFARESIVIGGDRACSDGVRAIVDTLPARSTLADARVCVIVALRTHRDGVDPLAVVAAGAAPLWPEAEFAEVRSENRERAMHRRVPRNLIDVLSVIEHPQCRAAYAPLLRGGLAAHGAHAGVDGQAVGKHALGKHAVVGHAFDTQAIDTHANNTHAVDASAIDDLIIVGLQPQAAHFDLALPLACSDGPAHPERLSDLPRRLLRIRHAQTLQKSIYTHDGGGGNDGGLRRAFLDCAECDPDIESHCLIDPRQHAPIARDAWLAQGFVTRVWPEAVVRTAEHVYLLNFQPFCPTRPQVTDASERMFAHWLRRVNALPSPQRSERVWHRATLAAPLFWSWKRSEGMLSTLLFELADAPTS